MFALKPCKFAGEKILFTMIDIPNWSLLNYLQIQTIFIHSSTYSLTRIMFCQVNCVENW